MMGVPLWRTKFSSYAIGAVGGGIGGVGFAILVGGVYADRFNFVISIIILAMVAAPALTPSFTGYDPATFPVRIDRPAIQPAGYAFSIWGLIYLWLLVHAGYGLFKRRDDAAFLRPVLSGQAEGLHTSGLAISS